MEQVYLRLLLVFVVQIFSYFLLTAMTTSKWEQLEEPAAGDQGSYRRSYDHSPASDDLDGQ